LWPGSSGSTGFPAQSASLGVPRRFGSSPPRALLRRAGPPADALGQVGLACGVSYDVCEVQRGGE